MQRLTISIAISTLIVLSASVCAQTTSKTPPASCVAPAQNLLAASSCPGYQRCARARCACVSGLYSSADHGCSVGSTATATTTSSSSSGGGGTTCGVAIPCTRKFVTCLNELINSDGANATSPCNAWAYAAHSELLAASVDAATASTTPPALAASCAFDACVFLNRTGVVMTAADCPASSNAYCSGFGIIKPPNKNALPADATPAGKYCSAATAGDQSLYLPKQYAACCGTNASATAMAPVSQCETTLQTCTASVMAGATTATSVCQPLFERCVKAYFRCVEDAATPISRAKSNPCPWAADMRSALRNENRQKRYDQCRKTVSALADANGCGGSAAASQQSATATTTTTNASVALAGYVSTVCGAAPAATPAAATPTSAQEAAQKKIAAPPPTADPVLAAANPPGQDVAESSPKKAEKATPVVLGSGVSSVTFGSDTCCELPDPNTGSCSCLGSNALASAVTIFHAGFSYASKEDRCYSRKMDLSFCLDKNSLPEAFGTTATSRRQTTNNGTTTTTAFNASAQEAQSKEDIALASLYSVRRDGTCAEPNVISGKCACPSAKHHARYIPVPLVDPVSNDTVFGEMFVCVTNATAVFLMSEAFPGVCFDSSDRNTTRCACLEGAERVNIPISYLNQSDILEGMLSMCAAPPREAAPASSGVATAGGSAGTSVAASAAGGPGASMVQGAGLVSSMDCASDEAQEMGGASSLVPFTIGDKEWGGVAALIVVSVGFMLLHVCVVGGFYVYYTKKLTPEELDKEEDERIAKCLLGARSSGNNNAADNNTNSANVVASPDSGNGDVADGVDLGSMASEDVEAIAKSALLNQRDTNPCLTKAMRTGKFPSYTMRILAFVFTGMLYESIRLLRLKDGTAGDYIFAVIALIWSVAWVSVSQYFGSVAAFDGPFIHRMYRKYTQIPKKLGAIVAFIMPGGYWSDDHQFLVKYYEFYDPFRPVMLQWIVGVHTFRSILLVILANLATAGDASRCKLIYILIAVVFFLTALFFMIARPHRLPFDNLFVTVISTCTGILAISLGLNWDVSSSAATIYQIILYTSLASLAVWLLFPFLEDLFEKWEDEAEEEASAAALAAAATTTANDEANDKRSVYEQKDENNNGATHNDGDDGIVVIDAGNDNKSSEGSAQSLTESSHPAPRLAFSQKEDPIDEPMILGQSGHSAKDDSAPLDAEHSAVIYGKTEEQQDNAIDQSPEDDADAAQDQMSGESKRHQSPRNQSALGASGCLDASTHDVEDVAMTDDEKATPAAPTAQPPNEVTDDKAAINEEYA